jgi:Zn-dependent metalloprotease
VHINSGIPNHAFYLACIEMGGFAWEKAGRIWYITLRDRLGNRANFAEAARVTYQVAGELYGASSLEQQAVRRGWEGVGLSVEGNGNGGCLATLMGLFKR